MRGRVKRAEVDAGERPGVTSTEREELKRLERENAELKRANEILKTAAAFFAAAELDSILKEWWPTSMPSSISSGSSQSTASL